MTNRYDASELISCIVSLQIMCENLALLDQQNNNTQANIYHQYMAQSLSYIAQILKHRLN